MGKIKPRAVEVRSMNQATEGTSMDPHFNEYLAAIAGMNDIYGDGRDDRPTEFHDASENVVPEQPAIGAAAA